MRANETLNGSCPDCYYERNSLASRGYAAALFLAGCLLYCLRAAHFLDSELVLYCLRAVLVLGSGLILYCLRAVLLLRSGLILYCLRAVLLLRSGLVLYCLRALSFWALDEHYIAYDRL